MIQESGNVLIAGVGGQGVILISEILSQACMEEGLDVKKSEVHGMAQRGGSVVSHVRFGQQVRSPLIEKGTADVLLALEELEALRWSSYLRPGGTIIVNRQQIRPLPVAVGLQVYPSEIQARLARRSGRLIAVNGVQIAHQAGSTRAVNIALFGALAAFLGFPAVRAKRLLRAKLPPKTRRANLSAFSRGWEIVMDTGKSRDQTSWRKECIQ